MVRNAVTLGMLTLAALSALGRAANAEPAGRLRYERGTGAEFCPDEVALRRAVAARLGEDPFDAAHHRTFRLTLGAVGTRLHGSVELVTDGVVEGRRELESDAESCAELVEAMALAVSLAINPNLVVEPTPTAEEPPAPSPAAPPPAPDAALTSPRRSPTHDHASPPEREKTSEGTPVTVAAGAAAHGAVGTGPGVAVGASTLVRAGRSFWHVGLEGRFDTLSQAAIGRNGTVHSTLLAGVVAPCARYRSLSGCPLLLLGSIAARSHGVTREDSDRGFFAAAGGRLGASAALADHLSLEARFDALYALTPVTIELDGAPVWRARASGTLGVGAVWEFL